MSISVLVDDVAGWTDGSAGIFNIRQWLPTTSLWVI